MGEYDEIELPPMQPFVRRHRRFSVRCAHCGEATVAPLPSAAKSTPFRPRIHALAVYLKSLQLFSYERLRMAMRDLFGLSISEGALMNIFKRTKPAFEAQRTQALTALHQARFVACDETGARIEGDNAYHWVFCCKQAVVHAAAFSRGAQVVRDVLECHRPQVWTSDRYSAQQSHADRQQTCLAHLARDARFAEENSQDDAPFHLRLWFDRAFALARDIETAAVSTVRVKRRALERDLNAILEADTACPLTRGLLNKVARARDQLLTFCDFPGEVEASTVGVNCEQAMHAAPRYGADQRKRPALKRMAFACDRRASRNIMAMGSLCWFPSTRSTKLGSSASWTTASATRASSA